MQISSIDTEINDSIELLPAIFCATYALIGITIVHNALNGFMIGKKGSIKIFVRWASLISKSIRSVSNCEILYLFNKLITMVIRFLEYTMMLY